MNCVENENIFFWYFISSYPHVEDKNVNKIHRVGIILLFVEKKGDFCIIRVGIFHVISQKGQG